MTLQKNQQVKLITLVVVLAITVFLMYPSLTNATHIPGHLNASGPSQPSGDGLQNPLGSQTITQIIKKIIEFLIELGAPILAIMVLYGGFRILTAGGNPQKVIDGRHIILWAVIGYAIILSSWGVIYIIDEIFGTNITGTL